MPILCQFLPKGLYKVASFFAVSLTPAPFLNNVEKTAEIYHAASLMGNGDGQVEASQVMTKYFRRSPILSERSLHNFGGSLLLLSPSAPPALEFVPHPVFINGSPSLRAPLVIFFPHLREGIHPVSAVLFVLSESPSIRSICSIPLLLSISF